MRHAAGGVSFCSGPAADPKTGNQAVISYLNGDRESPVVMGFLHSDQDHPPNTPAGASNWTFANGSIAHDANGNLTITAASITLTSNAGIALTSTSKLMHNNKDIGSDHTHSGVITGSSNTGVPN